MPTGMRRGCCTPGCAGEAVRDGRCAACAARLDAQRTDERGSPSARGYGRRWAKLRLLVLRAQPWCAVCGAPATDVDHVLPKRLGGRDAVDNLQSLCHACHTRKTMKERAEAARADG